MSTSPSGVKQSPASEMPAIVSGKRKDAFLEAFRSTVSKRAYQLFEELGRSDGNDLAHWLRAEDELCMRLPEVQQSGAWYTVSAPVVGVPADHIKISVDGERALISAEKSSSFDAGEHCTSQYYAVRWPENVNPETASAYLKNGTLTVVARRAAAGEGTEDAPAPQESVRQRPGSKRAKR